jgi:hypothetical protein
MAMADVGPVRACITSVQALPMQESLQILLLKLQQRTSMSCMQQHSQQQSLNELQHPCSQQDSQLGADVVSADVSYCMLSSAWGTSGVQISMCVTVYDT